MGEILDMIANFLDGWIITDMPPWLENAYGKWRDRIPYRPYNKTKYFNGTNYTYKIIHGQGNQGEAPVIAVYKKKRNKH